MGDIDSAHIFYSQWAHRVAPLNPVGYLLWYQAHFAEASFTHIELIHLMAAQMDPYSH